MELSKNYGQSLALAAGFDIAKGDYIITLDGDLQNDPNDIPKLISNINEGYDLICRWRYDRKDKLINRRIPSKIANKLIANVTGLKLHDYGCSLKAFKKDIFGAPTFLVNNKIFWGQDRLEYALEELNNN